MKLISLLVVMLLCSSFGWAENSLIPKDALQVKGDHFVVYYPSSNEQELARNVLERSEKFYNTIADDIGYARYQNYWTWEERVNIIIYKDLKEYTDKTKQPAWSLGFASLHQGFYKSRTIVSFKDQQGFLTELLPHEISHLILHDFIGFDRSIPLFFDEGVAQFEQEKDASVDYERILAQLIKEGKTIAFKQMFSFDIHEEKDPKRISIFYAESLYIIDFLVKTYGKDNFRDLCRQLRDGKKFEDALKKSYPSITSVDELESQWVQSMMVHL